MSKISSVSKTVSSVNVQNILIDDKCVIKKNNKNFEKYAPVFSKFAKVYEYLIISCFYCLHAALYKVNSIIKTDTLDLAPA